MDLEDFQPTLGLDDARIAVDRDTRRISVRVARWDETHSGFGEKVRIPRKVNVDAAHVGNAVLDDGSKIRVATLPMDTMHAPRDLGALHAAAWYENSGKGIAAVRYTADDEGIRADGILFEDVDDATIDRVLAASASGDWRAALAIKRYSDFEKVPADFVGSCIVNIPGYSDTFNNGAAGRKLSLAASAFSIVSFDDSSLTAASVGIDGISDQDIRNAWEELWKSEHPRPASTGGDCCESGAYSWVREFYAEPRKIIVEADNTNLEVPWGIAADGTIVFGDRTEVEQLWVPKGATIMGDTLTAAGEGEGCGEGCTNCGCGAKKDPAPPVTLSASALEALLGDDDEAKAKAVEEAHAALVAGGHAEPVDPKARQADRIESMLTALVFAQDD